MSRDRFVFLWRHFHVFNCRDIVCGEPDDKEDEEGDAFVELETEQVQHE